MGSGAGERAYVPYTLLSRTFLGRWPGNEREVIMMKPRLQIQRKGVSQEGGMVSLCGGGRQAGLVTLEGE